MKHSKRSGTINALVTFHSSIDYNKLQEGFKKKPTLDGKHVSIKTIPNNKTILVQNLPPNATYDSVLYRLENEKNGGREVEKVHLNQEERIALVEFKDPKDPVHKGIPLTKVILRYLSLHGEKLFDSLRLSSPGLSIEIGNDAVVVSGEKPLVDNSCASIEQFTGGLKCDSMNYGTPETAAGIKEKGANAIIQTIERKHQCGIVVVTKEETAVRKSFRTTPTSPVYNSNENRDRTMQCRYKYPNGKIIEIHQDDILNHAVYYLVNEANDQMKHSGGLAGAIVEKGGQKIQTDCARALRDQGKDRLIPGDVITTDSGGTLMCKKILHVVVPKHLDISGRHELRVEMHLRHCCNNVLKNATNGPTIAIPVLGIYNIPHDISAKSLVCAAHEFLQEHPTHPLREVHFVDNNPRAIEALMEEMTTIFAHDPNFHINELVRDSGDMAFDTPEGMEIRLTVGNIAKSTTNVIVNTTAIDLNLTTNPCSRAILHEAGNEIATFCKKWIEDNGLLWEGNFAITDGAKLKCDKVFHVYCPRGSDDLDEKELRQLVQKILNQVQTLSLTSISIPALGTGRLNFRPEFVAEVLFEEAMRFSAKQKSSLIIKQYNVVVYIGNARVVDIFKQKFQVYSSKAKAKEKSSEDDTRGVNVDTIHENIVEATTNATGFAVSDDIMQGTLQPKQQITLEIAAKSLNDIAKIKEELRQVEAEQSHCEIINVEKHLNEAQHFEILEVQHLHNVRIKCEPGIGFIQISGLAKNVLNAVGEIHRIIYAWEQERHNTDATVREVQWFYYETDAHYVIPEKYADNTSAKIERAYKTNPSGKIVLGEEIKYVIDFKSMTEKCLDPNENAILQVHRRPCDASPLPPNWEYQPIDSSTGNELAVYLFNIDTPETVHEYDKIRYMFMESVTSVRPYTQVLRIERIQNPRLYQIYQGQKNKMINNGNEMRLFHGTAKTSLDAINTHGFNKAYCGKNAVRLGKGSYFATQAWYSAGKTYSTPDENGLQYMYIARVLVGKYTKGTEGLLVPPPIDESNQTANYDSVVDNATKPTMFVIFFDYQSYPEYLITFKT